LSKLAPVINKTRREAPSRLKSELVRSIIEWIECTFQYRQRGEQTRSRLVSARFVPLIQAPEATVDLTGVRARVRLASAPERACKSEPVRMNLLGTFLSQVLVT